MIVVGDIAGIPVEETLLNFMPVGAAAVGAVAWAVRRTLRRLGRSDQPPMGKAASRQRRDRW
jgi:hypothetical protein